MNYNAMTDLELLHYLDLYSDDPLIRRLIDVLTRTRGEIISDLEEAGMDPQTWTFRTDWQSMYPGEYIEQLRKDVRYAEDELEHTKNELEDVTEDRDQLKTRNIMAFIEEVMQERKTASHKVQAATIESNRVREENAKLREQIDMWGKMNRV